MTCIKTGAKVLFTNYGKVLPADIYQVADAIVIRTHPNALDWGDGLENVKATHEVTSPFGGRDEFWRDDIGVFVVPAVNFHKLKE